MVLVSIARLHQESRSARRGFLQPGLLVLLTGALAVGISGCGGSAASTPAAASVTPAGISNVIVTATPSTGSGTTLSLGVTITG